jgi:hypothetical protein
VNGNLLSINQLNDLLGGNISNEGYRMLTYGFKKAQKNYGKENSKKLTLDSLFGTRNKVKGSKQYRFLLFNAFKTQIKEKCPLTNFSKIAGIPVPISPASKMMNCLWTKWYLSSEFKTFLFKFHHNILGLNSRVHHINAERDSSCFFCLKAKNLPAERETFTHFFWYCPTVEPLITRFFNTFCTVDPDMDFYFTGTYNMLFFKPALLVFSLAKFVFWQIKLKKRIPSWYMFITDFNYILGTVMKCSKKIKYMINNCVMFRQPRDE